MAVFYLYLVLAVLVGIVATIRGRSGLTWLLISLFITPLLGGLIIMALPRRAHQASLMVSRTNQIMPDFLPLLMSWANIVFWIAASIATLIVPYAMINYLLNVSEGDPVLSITKLILAVTILLIGSLFRKAAKVSND